MSAVPSQTLEGQGHCHRRLENLVLVPLAGDLDVQENDRGSAGLAPILSSVPCRTCVVGNHRRPLAGQEVFLPPSYTKALSCFRSLQGGHRLDVCPEMKGAAASQRVSQVPPFFCLGHENSKHWLGARAELDERNDLRAVGEQD